MKRRDSVPALQPETKKHTSRRDFLGISAASFATALTSDLSSRSLVDANLRSAAAAPGAIPSAISMWVTAGDQRYAPVPRIEWGPAPERRPGGNIVLNPSLKFQKILGFGAALTDAACYMFNQLAPPAREQLFHEFFHSSQMGLGVCRICVGSSDYSRNVYSFDEGEPDPDLKRFSIDHDREYIIPILRQAREVNPDLFLFCSPWSPPGWMKFNGSMLGGSMRKFYFPAYAKYYLKFLQAYAEAGVPIQALTSQNEVDTDQDGKMPACLWGQEYEIEFLRDHLGPLLESNGVPTKPWILDHNYNLWGRVICSLADDRLRRYCNAVAWHGYVGTPDMMTKVKNAYPEVEMHWTEGGPDYRDPDYLTDWCKWGSTFAGVLRNWCKSITAWNLALDEQGRPNVGPFSCGGIVTINSQSKDISRSGQYWAFAHYSRVIRRDARRFDSQGSIPNIEHVAFENPDGQRVLILANSGPAHTVGLHIGSNAAEIPLQPNSLTTLVWH